MISEKNFVVIDIKRVTLGQLKAQKAHCSREKGLLDHCDTSRTHLNKTVIGIEKDPYQSAMHYIEEKRAKIDKRNETPFTSLILTASPEFFVADPGNESRWEDVTTRWVQDTFGDDVVYMEYHHDEKTDHAHVTIVPTYQRMRKGKPGKVAVSHHKHPAFQGKDSYHRLLDAYEEACKPLGLRRSRPTDIRSPTTKSQHATALLNEAEQIKANAIGLLEYQSEKITTAVTDEIGMFFADDLDDEFAWNSIEILPPESVDKKDIELLDAKSPVRKVVSFIGQNLSMAKDRLERQFRAKWNLLVQKEQDIEAREWKLTRKETSIAKRERIVGTAELMRARKFRRDSAR